MFNQFINPLLSVGIVFVILLVSEFLWTIRELRGEMSRKFVHMMVGTFVAFWPFFMTWRAIQVISVAFLVVVLITRRLHIFRAIYAVRRYSYGEPLFAVAIGLAAVMTHSKWVFAAAVLHLSLADGLAALIGVRFGKQRRNIIFGHYKSIVGTVAFWVVSFIIITTIAVLSGSGFTGTWPIILWLPTITALIENMSTFGLDNLAVPLLIVAVLNPLLR
ncbi:MAG: phosphatidate cytidylyltransferase [Candidatus Saccharibacteria bacterium]|nr:phosphatidate cytidylyltransferase [Candidatus Saccharibacteria bacterium]